MISCGEPSLAFWNAVGVVHTVQRGQGPAAGGFAPLWEMTVSPACSPYVRDARRVRGAHLGQQRGRQEFAAHQRGDERVESWVVEIMSTRWYAATTSAP
jgi:hypothetical protein